MLVQLTYNQSEQSIRTLVEKETMNLMTATLLDTENHSYAIRNAKNAIS